MRAQSTLCSVEGCTNPLISCGLCNKHYLRWKKYGDPLGMPAPRVIPSRQTCIVDGCNTLARGTNVPYCEMHYMRMRRNGDPLVVKVDITPYDHCQYCGKPTNRKFCGARCATRYYRACAREIPCAHCGTMFEPIGKNIVCSPACRVEADCQRNKQYRIERWSDPAFRDRSRLSSHKRRALKYATNVTPFMDSEIFERDGWVCGLCGESVDRDASWPNPEAASLDHIIPLSLGGPHEPGNVQLAHLRCNWRKGDKA